MDQDKPRSKTRRRYNIHGRRKNRLRKEQRRELEAQAELLAEPPAQPTLTREWHLFATRKEDPCPKPTSR